MGQFLNGNSQNGHSHQSSADPNVIRLPTLAERDSMRKEQERLEKRNASRTEPVINMPTATKCLLGVMVAVHLVLAFILSAEHADWVVMQFGFIPVRLQDNPLDPFGLASLVTHMFLHGGWMHLAMNGFMLAAFGTGIERWLGARRMLILFFASGLFGAAAHFLLNTNSIYPMIGASGALSGLFAGAIVMMNRGQREIGGRLGILPFALLWIAVSIGFGMMGAPGGGAVAWAAHVGGFLGGFAVLKLMRV